MKRKSLYKLLSILAIATVFFTACTKDNSDVRLDPKLSTAQVINVSAHEATVIGFVVASGDGFTEKGICYNTAPAPTTSESKMVYTGENTTATFSVTLIELDYATTYYARAYAINAMGTMYGEEFTFTTSPIAPTVTTAAVTGITGTTATTGGNVTVTGGADITARGVCYGPDANPTVDGSKTSDGTGDGEFVSALSGLSGLTTYHVRAYATNSAGTSYGEDIEFTTLVSVRNWYVPGNYVAASYPGLGMNDWDPATSPQIKSTEASPENVEGYVYMANGTNEWKIATKPNWDGPNYGAGAAAGTLDADGGNFNSPAGYYKINVNPTALTYTAVATSWGVIGSASANGWNDETALTYNPGLQTWRGGIHLTAGEFKFRANHSWDYNYGSTAANSTLDGGGSNIPATVESDYYFVLDLSHPHAYTYQANRWGLIGDATPGGWSDDTNLTWDETAQVMKITVALTVGSIKFRANDDWAINLGGDLNALSQDGANISIAEAGTYAITLDLGKAAPSCTITKMKK
ncbi:MAG: SusF/SusE family outer membrane protein [Bacteroidales bacterium]|nr:SusF/SusE family outer membrane protein [Bacteroidales bacterium]